jgi:hypothetical protein
MPIVKKCLVALAISAVGMTGRAYAQYTLSGSDTLEFVMKDSISKMSQSTNCGTIPGQSTSCPWIAPNSVDYLGGGSTTGENAVVADKQSIAAMSRNLKSAVIGTGVGKFDANGTPNVVGLDAALLDEYQTAIGDLVIPFYTEAIDAVQKAKPNTWGTCSGNPAVRCGYQAWAASSSNVGCGGTLGTCVADTTSTKYSNIVQVLLAGVDGTGGTLACAHPARLQAMKDLNTFSQGYNVAHWLRRDDNSGTTDTFKDKMSVKNFCNGRARGIVSDTKRCSGVSGSANAQFFPCSQDSDCAAAGAPGGTCTVLTGYGTTASWNLANQDIDPIRQPCTDLEAIAGGNRQPTTCTNIYDGTFCTAAENPRSGRATCDPKQPYSPDSLGNTCTGTDYLCSTNADCVTKFPGRVSNQVCAPNNGCKCTQGFVVALSVGDNSTDLQDVTVTISSRVSTNGGSLMGYAGRQSAFSGNFTSAPTLNGFDYDPDSVRGDIYLLSRRLFVARASANTDLAKNTGEAAVGGSGKKSAENTIFDWITKNRCNVKDIVESRGFLTCTDSCGTAPTAGLCATGAAPAPSFPDPVVPGDGVGGGYAWNYDTAYNYNAAAGLCAATNPIGANGVGDLPLAQTTTTAASKAGMQGGSCPSGFGTRPAGYACSLSRECQTGLVCRDNGRGIGLLTCQTP